MGANKYFWLRMNKDFFKRHDIRIIESMPNGKDYILFYLKLLCESVDHEGNLRFSEIIPYNEEMLSTITNTNVDIVRSAIKCFTSLNMMELLDDGTYFMTEVSKMIGSSVQDDHARESTRLRVQAYRERQKQLEQKEKRYSNVTCNGEIDIEIEKDIELDKKKEISKEKNPGGTSPLDTPTNIKHKYGEYGWVKLTDKQYENLCKDFNKDLIDRVITKLDEYMQSNGNKNKYKDCNLVIRKAIRENWFKVNDSEEFSSQSKREIQFEEAIPGQSKRMGKKQYTYANTDVPWENL